jgi:uncharacterized protein YdeI (YjbR/CyaY-like superfamily)
LYWLISLTLYRAASIDANSCSVMRVQFFKSTIELGRWLENHHAQAQELWVGFYKKGTLKPSVTYREALDGALCFGWIDGVRKSLGSDSYTIRFSPRKPRSIWSAVNIKRAEQLTKLGLMQAPGITAFAERLPENQDRYSCEKGDRSLADKYIAQLRANEAAWRFFQAQPPGYQRKASWWLMSAKKEETRLKRLGILITDSEHGQRIAALTSKKIKGE